MVNAVKRTYNAAKVCIIFKTKVFVPSVKDQLPKTSISNLIYSFTCKCGSLYVGMTQRQLGKRVKEHLPMWLRKGEQRPSNSVIATHLMQCDQMDDPEGAFKAVVRVSNTYLLSTYEALLIRKLRPNLCRQTDFVKTLHLQWV